MKLLKINNNEKTPGGKKHHVHRKEDKNDCWLLIQKKENQKTQEKDL